MSRPRVVWAESGGLAFSSAWADAAGTHVDIRVGRRYVGQLRREHEASVWALTGSATGELGLLDDYGWHSLSAAKLAVSRRVRAMALEAGDDG